MLALVHWFLSVLKRNGAFRTFQWTTTAKQSKASEREVGVKVLTKTTTATVRTGVEYKNLAENLDRETGALPWGEWFLYPFVVTHKGNYYGRIYAKRDTVRSIYFVDGTEVDRAEWLSFQPPSAAKQREDNGSNTLTLTIKLDNLQIV